MFVIEGKHFRFPAENASVYFIFNGSCFSALVGQSSLSYGPLFFFYLIFLVNFNVDLLGLIFFLVEKIAESAFSSEMKENVPFWTPFSFFLFFTFPSIFDVVPKNMVVKQLGPLRVSLVQKN